MKVSQTEFILQVAERSGESKTVVGNILSATQGQIIANLQAGKYTTLTQLGTIEPTHRDARNGRNPATGEAMWIGASNSAKLKVGKALKDSLN